jgi:hypothetical protein
MLLFVVVEFISSGAGFASSVGVVDDDDDREAQSLVVVSWLLHWRS